MAKENAARKKVDTEAATIGYDRTDLEVAAKDRET